MVALCVHAPRHAHMIAVIFEVIPAKGEMDSYLDHAAKLRPMLEHMDGFISVERFRSLSDPDKLLSLSFFEDEAAVVSLKATGCAWRG